MIYLIRGHDREQSLAARAGARDRHLERIDTLRRDGRLVLAGPLPAIDAPNPGPAGFVGSLILAEFDSLAAAREWAESDPYIETGAWQAVDVHPFVQAAP